MRQGKSCSVLKYYNLSNQACKTADVRDTKYLGALFCHFNLAEISSEITISDQLGYRIILLKNYWIKPFVINTCVKLGKNIK